MADDLWQYMRRYYAEASLNYKAALEPIFSRLAEGLIALTPLAPDDRIIDLGTGSGAAAEQARKHGCRVLGFDYSRPMIALGAGQKGQLVQGDMHAVALREESFDGALASFAFNNTDPARSVPETLRILRRGGWLALQEWGTEDPLSALLDETLAGYAVEDPDPALAAWRESQQRAYPWDEIETSDSITDLLNGAGFERIKVDIVTESVAMPDAEMFIRYKLNWPTRRAEVGALDEDIRRLFFSDLRENLAAHTQRDGQVIWEPNIVRVLAFRPG